MIYNREVLVEILVYHWRTNSSGCGCGWAELGKSWPEHIANVYESSVAFRETTPLGPDFMIDDGLLEAYKQIANRGNDPTAISMIKMSRRDLGALVDTILTLKRKNEDYPERTNEHGNVIDYGPQFDEENKDG